MLHYDNFGYVLIDPEVASTRTTTILDASFVWHAHGEHTLTQDRSELEIFEEFVRMQQQHQQQKPAAKRWLCCNQTFLLCSIFGAKYIDTYMDSGFSPGATTTKRHFTSISITSITRQAKAQRPLVRRKYAWLAHHVKHSFIHWNVVIARRAPSYF